jgi:hypothetical protein
MIHTRQMRLSPMLVLLPLLPVLTQQGLHRVCWATLGALKNTAET